MGRTTAHHGTQAPDPERRATPHEVCLQPSRRKSNELGKLAYIKNAPALPRVSAHGADRAIHLSLATTAVNARRHFAILLLPWPERLIQDRRPSVQLSVAWDDPRRVLRTVCPGAASPLREL